MELNKFYKLLEQLDLDFKHYKLENGILIQVNGRKYKYYPEEQVIHNLHSGKYFNYDVEQFKRDINKLQAF